MPTFVHGGVRIRYDTWGAEGAPPVVLLHEAGYDCRMWFQAAMELSNDYFVIAPNLPEKRPGEPHVEVALAAGTALPAAGEDSEEPAGAPAAVLIEEPQQPDVEPELDAELPDPAQGVQWMAEATLALLAELGVEVAAVGGCGLGAAIAATIARTEPARVAALVLADLVPAAGDTGAAWGSYPPDPAEAIVALRGPHALGKRIAAGFHDGFVAQGVRNRYARMDYDGLHWALQCLGHVDPIETLLDGVSVPSLVCVASEDPAKPVVEKAAQKMAAARVLTFRDTSRPCVHGRPEAFVDQLRRFLASVEGGSFSAGSRTV